MKYKGPAKPVPTHIEIVSDKAERIVFLLGLIVVALDVFIWRP
jgi:hypothetical protein